MSQPDIPFDNIYTSQDGFIARQARLNERYNRLFTWEFSRTCNSFVTLPLAPLKMSDPSSTESHEYSSESTVHPHSHHFSGLIAQRNLQFARVLNLNVLLILIKNIISRHRTLAALAGVSGPFYIKAKMSNVWRTVPFIDSAAYIAHIESFDVPVVQDEDLTAPIGRWPDGFVIAPEKTEAPDENELAIEGSVIRTWTAIMQALGIPDELLEQSSQQIVNAAFRELEQHRNRLQD